MTACVVQVGVGRLRRGAAVIVFTLATLGLALGMAFLGGCSEREVDQGSPESTIASARALVMKGQPHRITELVHAEDEAMRRFLTRAGVLLRHTERLAAVIGEKFPKDVERLRESGESQKGLVSILVQSARGQARGRQAWDPKKEEERRRQVEDAMLRVFADPFAFLRESEGRLTTKYLTDDMVALQWDGEAIMPPLGLQMKLADDGKWYFQLPLKAPLVQQYIPKTKEEWEIWGSLLGVFDKVVVDLRKDIESGKLASLERVSQAAGEKAFLPAVMVFVAYGRAMEARKAGG
jgi:hypothetical protein